ncbi:MAG: response regulator [Euryarchaeota archaeon]|nr:response regulator [Euryarchaeota archaeon]
MAKVKIIVVEDERIAAEDIKDGLESLGYTVTAVVSSGKDAIKTAEELQPDLIIMDIRLEGDMDGIEAAEKIRARFGIPVIYLTAYSDENTVQRAKITEPSGFILKGPLGFIQKPFEESELHSAIEITLYKHRMEKRLRDHEKWLATILENINDAVIATDSMGLIKFMNPVAEDLTGWIQLDAIGKDLSEIFIILSDESSHTGETDLNSLFQDRFISTRHLRHAVLISKDKTEIHIHGAITPIIDEKGNVNGLVLVFHNVDDWE